MALMGWIFRILMILFIIRLVLRFFSRLTGAASSTESSRRPNQPATREGGQLVRDPHCGTYVPMGRALKQGSGGSVEYFCSETCRKAWAERKAV